MMEDRRGVKPARLETKEIKQLIAYHQNGLDQYRQHMSPSAEVLEERTIDALKDLLQRREEGAKEGNP